MSSQPSLIGHTNTWGICDDRAADLPKSPRGGAPSPPRSEATLSSTIANQGCCPCVHIMVQRSDGRMQSRPGYQVPSICGGARRWPQGTRTPAFPRLHMRSMRHADSAVVRRASRPDPLAQNETSPFPLRKRLAAEDDWPSRAAAKGLLNYLGGYSVQGGRRMWVGMYCRDREAARPPFGRRHRRVAPFVRVRSRAMGGLSAKRRMSCHQSPSRGGAIGRAYPPSGWKQRRRSYVPAPTE